jgi:hypothetical protein
VASREEPKIAKNEERGMHPKSLRLSGMLLISACPGLLFGEAVTVEHRRWLVVTPLAVFRFPLFVLWFGRHTEALFLKRRVFGFCLIFPL